ncbi:rodlin [Streptomyces sp. NBC_01471]|uniref:rodlin n=1 Tax=Streptomyces sp. NBC_01471 TaxID=2903879 RepID=UPI00324D6B21
MRARTALTAAALAAAAIAGAAGNAAAIGDGGTTSLSGNGSEQAFGNSKTDGAQSPQLTLVQGSLNKLCAGVPVKANVGSLVGVVPVAVQDIPVLSSPQNQQCTENSSQAKGDEPLSHILDQIPVLSGNGVGNG